jgi:hypothetical protein
MNFTYYMPVVKVILILLIFEIILHSVEILIDLNIIKV